MERVTLIQASAHQLAAIPDGSVHCIITSPPYWGMRQYAGEQDVDWPGVAYANPFGGPDIEIPAQRCELGLEPEPTAYLGHLALCLREWWRVLRPDGTLWVNLGDTYAQDTKWGGRSSSKNVGSEAGGYGAARALRTRSGCKNKDLVGIPWRFALIAQAEGWYLRSDIVWYKLNAMPESVTDRPSKAHEYLFLLAKSPTYYYDADAIREQGAPTTSMAAASFWRQQGKRSRVLVPGNTATHRPDRSDIAYIGTRSRRSVWRVPISAYKGAHFATFPGDLVEPCILAGTSERGCCSMCGVPWVRVTERKPMQIRRSGRADVMGEYGRTQASGTMRSPAMHRTLGWHPGCGCDAGEPVPCVVLDPFAGSGTTLQVAVRLGRRAIGVDLAYHDLARRRIGKLDWDDPLPAPKDASPLEALPLFAATAD